MQSSMHVKNYKTKNEFVENVWYKPSIYQRWENVSDL